MGAQWQTGQSETPRRGANNFAAGLNTGVPPMNVADNQSTDEYGWDTDKLPALHTKKGRTLYGTAGASRVNLLTTYGTKHLVRAVGNAIQYNNTGTTWTQAGTLPTAADIDSTNFNDKLIMVNGTDPVKVWNGTALTDLNANAPKGKYIAHNTTRLWIAKGDVLHFSAHLDETDWTSAENSGSVQYYTPNGGDITGLKYFDNQICVFKRSSFAEMFGKNYFGFELRSNSDNVGCVSYKTIQEVGELLFWLGENDVYTYRGGRPSAIGQPIRRFLESVNKAYSHKCVGGTDGIKYYLGLVTGTSTEVNVWLFFDPRFNIWRVASKNDRFTFSANFNNEWYTGDESGQTFKMNQGTTDNGSTISWLVTSGVFDEELPEAEKEYYEMHIQAYLPAGSTMTVSVSTRDRDLGDGKDFTDIYTATTGNLAQGMNIIVPLDTVPITKWFRYKLSGTGEVEIYDVERYFHVHPTQH